MPSVRLVVVVHPLGYRNQRFSNSNLLQSLLHPPMPLEVNQILSVSLSVPTATIVLVFISACFFILIEVKLGMH